MYHKFSGVTEEEKEGWLMFNPRFLTHRTDLLSLSVTQTQADTHTYTYIHTHHKNPIFDLTSQ